MPLSVLNETVIARARNGWLSRNSSTLSTPLEVCIQPAVALNPDRKSTRLNSSHSQISYAVFCLKKKTILCLQLFSYTLLTSSNTRQAAYSFPALMHRQKATLARRKLPYRPALTLPRGHLLKFQA